MNRTLNTFTIILLSFTLILTTTKPARAECNLQFVKSSSPPDNTKWVWLLSSGKGCNTKVKIIQSLDVSIEKYCPQCSIYIFDNIKAIEYDYKIMNWMDLNISMDHYSKLRNNSEKQKLYKNHFILEYNDIIYPNSTYHNYGFSELFPAK